MVGCGGGSGLVDNAKNPRLRAYNATNTTTNVTVTDKNGTTDLLVAKPANTMGDFAIVENGNDTITFRNANNNAIISTQVKLLELNHQYTAMGYGNTGENKMFLLEFNGNPVLGNSAVQFGHASGVATAVDVYVTAPGDALAGRAADFNDVPIDTVAGYIGISAGQKRVRVTAFDNQVPIVDQTFGMEAGKSYSLVFPRINNLPRLFSLSE